MSILKRVILALVMLFIIASPASACIGARQAAMGWAGVAISDDATAAYWNPAAMVWAKDGVMFDNVYDRTAVAVKHDKYGFCYVDEWDKSYSDFSICYELSQSEAVGISVGTFAAKPASPEPDYRGLTLSASYIAKTDYFRYGVLLQNGFSVRPGIAYVNDFLTVSASVYDLFSVSLPVHCQAGIEIRPLSFIAFRSGFDQFDSSVFYGVGLNLLHCSLDFVKTPYGDYYSFSLLI